MSVIPAASEAGLSHYGDSDPTGVRLSRSNPLDLLGRSKYVGLAESLLLETGNAAGDEEHGRQDEQVRQVTIQSPGSIPGAGRTSGAPARHASDGAGPLRAAPSGSPRAGPAAPQPVANAAARSRGRRAEKQRAPARPRRAGAALRQQATHRAATDPRRRRCRGLPPRLPRWTRCPRPLRPRSLAPRPPAAR